MLPLKSQQRLLLVIIYINECVKTNNLQDPANIRDGVEDFQIGRFAGCIRCSCACNFISRRRLAIKQLVDGVNRSKPGAGDGRDMRQVNEQIANAIGEGFLGLLD